MQSLCLPSGLHKSRTFTFHAAQQPGMFTGFVCVPVTWSRAPTAHSGLWVRALAGEAKVPECTRSCWKHRINRGTRAIPLLGSPSFTRVCGRCPASTCSPTLTCKTVWHRWASNYLLLFFPLYCFNFRFCVGDKFFLKNNMILCQTDYEEGLMKEGYAPQVRWSDATSLRIKSTTFFYLFCSTCI